MELTETIRALSAAASAGCRPTARAKWPRWLTANCVSRPSGVRVSSGGAITPALLTRMCNGPVQAATNAATVDRSARSSRSTVNLPDCGGSSVSRRAATRAPAAVSRTARVTSAPAAASARAVSTPIPELAPVTTARRPCRSTPSMTSAAVVLAPNMWGV